MTETPRNQPNRPEHCYHLWEFQCDDEVNGIVMRVLACELCGLERLA